MKSSELSNGENRIALPQLLQNRKLRHLCHNLGSRWKLKKWLERILVLVHSTISPTRMWANAQPDGRPAEHRWRPLFNVAKFG